MISNLIQVPDLDQRVGLNNDQQNLNSARDLKPKIFLTLFINIIKLFAHIYNFICQLKLFEKIQLAKIIRFFFQNSIFCLKFDF